MFGAGMLNLGSILLGLAAWGCPAWYLSRRMKGKERSGWSHLASLGCCGASLWFQILYDSHLARVGDVSAWLDTVDAVAKVSGFLLVTTLLVNVVVLLADRGLERENEEHGGNAASAG